jgi:hypothetical protein
MYVCKNPYVPLFVHLGRAVAQAITRRFPTPAARAQSQVRLCGFVIDKQMLGQVFSEYFSFPCHPLHRLLNIQLPPIIRGWYIRPNSGQRTR